MNKKIQLLIGAAVLALAAVSVTPVFADSSAPAGAQTNQTAFDKILAITGTPTNYAVEPYMTYAPKAPTKVGGGILGIYNVNNYVGLGLGVDWLGDFSLVSANVQLQAPFHPMPNQFPSLVVAPFILGGVATASSGAGNFNGSISSVEDIGAYVKFGHILGGQFNTGICYGQWTGVGKYDVKRYHAFIGWSHGF